MEMIWATRGRDWGFRFLLDGGLDDPLLVYEDAFATLTAPEGISRAGDVVAVRFLDPEGRQDAAGRTIPHDVVLSGAVVELPETLEEIQQLIWRWIGERYAAIWDRPAPEGAV